MKKIKCFEYKQLFYKPFSTEISTAVVLRIKEQKRLFLCPQTFIVKIRIILFGCTSTIHSGTERRGIRLVARETERESVCAT